MIEINYALSLCLSLNHIIKIIVELNQRISNSVNALSFSPEM